MAPRRTRPTASAGAAKYKEERLRLDVKDCLRQPEASDRTPKRLFINLLQRTLGKVLSRRPIGSWNELARMLTHLAAFRCPTPEFPDVTEAENEST